MTGLDRETRLNDPYLEWSLTDDHAGADPYDVAAYATFEHESTGATRRSLMFPGEDGSWRFRFTGTAPGTWSVETTGPGGLGGRTGTVTVEDEDKSHNGFLGTDDGSWVW